MKLLFATLLILSVVGPDCNRGQQDPSSQGESPEEVDRSKLSAMEAEIDRLIGVPSCTDKSECRYVPFGAKPCGGPWKYKIYSAGNPEAARLLERVQQYDALNATLNRKYGWISDCSVPAPPSLECRSGRCVDAGLTVEE